jgi:GNAT superfamily N-acetyltransferase
MMHIRVACADDLPALATVRYHDRPALHRDRIAAFNPDTFQYFIAELGHQLVGFGLLLLERPLGWTAAHDSFPILIDLFVAETYRSRGVGRRLIQHMEAVARQHHKSSIYLSVAPDTNPRALQLYLRLGYLPVQEQPYHSTWHFSDSDGALHAGEEWVIDMRKQLV